MERSTEERTIRALTNLLQAWAASQTLWVDPQTTALDPDADTGVKAAARFLNALLAGAAESSDTDPEIASLLTDSLEEIAIETAAPQNRERLVAAAAGVADAATETEVAEAMWTALCPNAVGIRGDWDQSVADVRARRALHDARPAARPIRPNQVLVTSNVLLGLPLGDGAGLPEAEGAASRLARSETPLAYFDHPIPLDMPRHRHELLYGLSAFDEAVAFEMRRGILTDPPAVVLSISTTHEALEPVAVDHVRRVLENADLPNIAVYAFDESATAALVAEVLSPALQRIGRSPNSVARVFGVQGPYGRHYSFLKAIAPLWAIAIDAQTRATFKIDLDQVFPQTELVEQTGETAFSNLCEEMWGGAAVDSAGHEVSLEFAAGTLVNQADIHLGIHVPDVVDPGPPLFPEQLVFYSALPQAASTEAEMMPAPAGGNRQRVHITGGTTGATVAGLRRWRPFSPSFWSRAEDQAFGMSLPLGGAAATLHLPNLVMRHDKTGFAADAIAAAEVDKLIGDHERILMFSAYARLLDPELVSVSETLAPFTGAFVSHMPTTVALLRLAVTTLSWHEQGRPSAGELFTRGLSRLDRARVFVGGADFANALNADQRGWNDYYEALDVLEKGLLQDEPWVIAAATAARQIIDKTRVAGK